MGRQREAYTENIKSSLQPVKNTQIIAWGSISPNCWFLPVVLSEAVHIHQTVHPRAPMYKAEVSDLSSNLSDGRKISCQQRQIFLKPKGLNCFSREEFISKQISSTRKCFILPEWLGSLIWLTVDLNVLLGMNSVILKNKTAVWQNHEQVFIVTVSIQILSDFFSSLYGILQHLGLENWGFWMQFILETKMANTQGSLFSWWWEGNLSFANNTFRS